MFKIMIFVYFLVLTQFAFTQSEEINPDNETENPPLPEAPVEPEIQLPVYSPFALMLIPGLQLQLNHDNIVVGNSPLNNANIQLGGVAQATNILGLQIGAVNIVNENLSGLQIALISNSTLGAASGVQIAPLVNVAQHMQGMQISPLLNWTEKLGGLQLGVIANTAEEMDGIQVAYLVNIADKANGLQIGIINIANEANGLSLGMINFIKDGIFQAAYHVHSDDLDEVTLKTGNKWLYTKYSLAVDQETGNSQFAAGLGLRLSFSKILYLEQDAMLPYAEDFFPPLEYQTTLGLFPSSPFNIEGAVKLRRLPGDAEYSPHYSVGVGFDFAKLANIL